MSLCVCVCVCLWVCVLLFQHEKYSSQLQMSLKSSEKKETDVEDRARLEKTQSTKSTQGTWKYIKLLTKSSFNKYYYKKSEHLCSVLSNQRPRGTWTGWHCVSVCVLQRPRGVSPLLCTVSHLGGEKRIMGVKFKAAPNLMKVKLYLPSHLHDFKVTYNKYRTATTTIKKYFFSRKQTTNCYK